MTATVGVVVLSVMAGAWAAPGSIQKASPTKTKSEVSLAGCLGATRTEGTFILYNAKRDLKDPNEVAADYLVVPLADLALDTHLKDIVRLTGKITPAKAEKPAEAETDSDSVAPEDNLPRLNAKSLKTESGSCVTDGDGDSDGGGGGWTGGSGGSIGFADFAFSDLDTLGRSNSAFNTQGLTSSTLFSEIGGFDSIDSVSSVSGTTLIPISSTSFSTSGGSTSTGGTAPLSTLTTTSVGGFVATGGAASPFTTPVTITGSSAGSAPIANPEPASMVLFGLGLLALAILGRKRIQRTA